MIGSSAPDALKTLNGQFHTFSYAKFQLNYSVTHRGGSFDSLAFSQGYGCHLAADAVGHHSGGYLSKPGADHDLSLAVDAYIFQDMMHRSMPPLRFDDDSIQFSYAAATAYAKTTHSVPEYTLETFRNAILKFDGELGVETAIVGVMPRAMLETTMVNDSFCKASKFQDVISPHNTSSQWVRLATSYWVKSPASDVDAFVNELYKQHRGTCCDIL